MSDFDQPPASDDAGVQQYLDTQWRESVRAAREALEAIRKIYPEMTHHLPETGVRHIKRAMGEIEEGLSSLHSAGRHVLGEENYDEFLASQTNRQIGR